MVKNVSAQPLSGPISNRLPSRLSTRRLLWAGAATSVAVMAANTLVRFVAAAVLQPDPGFVPLGPATPAFFSLLGTLGAVVLLAVIGRYSTRPVWLFRRVVLIALPVTWVPDVLLLAVPSFPGTNLPEVLALMLMHAVAVALIVTVLPSLLGEQPRS